MIKLYTTHCPKCKVIANKLRLANFDYEEIIDEAIMKEKGFQNVPMLETDEGIFDFMTANKWINNRMSSNLLTTGTAETK
jgi:hypothetical protein